MVGKDFVKFVFTFLSLPVATVTRLLITKSSSNTGMVGCLGDLYKSLEEMEDFYETTFTGNKLYKDSALYPKVPFSVSSTAAATKVPLLPPSDIEPFCQKLYTCPDSHRNFSEDPLAVCPLCKKCMNVEMQYIDRAAAGKVVKDEDEDEELPDVDEGEDEDDSDDEDEDEDLSYDDDDDNNYRMYMVTDDLCLSATTFITQWRLKAKFDIESFDALESREVDMTLPQGLKLLHASFQGKSVLTSVFLDNAGA